MKNKTLNYTIPILLIAIGMAARALPHPANFTPIGAIAFFAGMYLTKRLSLITPLLAMLISDIFIGFYAWQIMLSVYLSFGIMSALGVWAGKNKNFFNIIGGVLLGSIIFFILTNTAVWAFGNIYEHNINGLTQSYVMAIPFFRNSLFGNLFYISIFAGSMEVLKYLVNKKKYIVTGQAK